MSPRATTSKVPLPAILSTTCPGCRGTIAGDIQHAHERMAAEEALPRSKPALRQRPALRAAGKDRRY